MVELFGISKPVAERTEPLPVKVHVTAPASRVCKAATVSVPVRVMLPVPTFVVVFAVPSPRVRLLNVHVFEPPKLPPLPTVTVPPVIVMTPSPDSAPFWTVILAVPDTVPEDTLNALLAVVEEAIVQPPPVPEKMRL
ncbi:MAG: hypothetical protein UV60_C0009G0003 [Parcubacteria group bacterium GW2011_GWA2_43_11]|nr:MAG: hypothetical protein UV60_C0009G0003 [Parcubacteria group bacterium GW2011_GWA2_43_11]